MFSGANAPRKHLISPIFSPFPAGRGAEGLRPQGADRGDGRKGRTAFYWGAKGLAIPMVKKRNWGFSAASARKSPISKRPFHPAREGSRGMEQYAQIIT